MLSDSSSGSSSDGNGDEWIEKKGIWVQFGCEVVESLNE